MDNLTHSLVGVLVAKTGLERLSPYSMAAAIVAANAPDLDLVSAIGGPWSYLEHHRGGSHSIPGVLAVSLGVPLSFWIIDRLWSFFRGRVARVRLGGLTLVCVLAGVTHPLLDWTNNYGVRPLLPWNRRWFYGDLVFIMDPWIWLLLGGAAFLLTSRTKIGVTFWTALATVLSIALILGRVFSLPSSGSLVANATLAIWFAGLIILALLRRRTLDGSAWTGRAAIAALLIIPIYWGTLAVFHHRAVMQAESSARSLALNQGEQVVRVVAMPTFGNPLRWQAIAESDVAVYRFVQDLGAGAGNPQDVVRFAKPGRADLPAVERASSDPRAKAWSDFARFPLARVMGNCPQNLVVRFADMRYTDPGAPRAPFSLDVPLDCGYPNLASPLAGSDR
jgi:inner membrane protein